MMEKALCDVTSGVLSVHQAALSYGVPKSTLHDRVSGRVVPGAVGGAPRYDELAEGCAEVGCAKSV